MFKEERTAPFLLGQEVCTIKKRIKELEKALSFSKLEKEVRELLSRIQDTRRGASGDKSMEKMWKMKKYSANDKNNEEDAISLQNRTRSLCSASPTRKVTALRCLPYQHKQERSDYYFWNPFRKASNEAVYSIKKRLTK